MAVRIFCMKPTRSKRGFGWRREEEKKNLFPLLHHPSHRWCAHPFANTSPLKKKVVRSNIKGFENSQMEKRSRFCFGKDEEIFAHLRYRNASVDAQTPDLVYLVLETEVEKATRGVFFYAHGLFFESVKQVVEYAMTVEESFLVRGGAPGWFDWLLGRKVESERVCSVIVCCFDSLNACDVRVLVEFATGRVTEQAVKQQSIEERAPDMRAVAVSQLLRVGKCGLALVPHTTGVPVNLIDVTPLPKGAALAFCMRHDEFVRKLDNVATLLDVETRWGSDEVINWIDKSFTGEERALLEMRVFESVNPASGLHVGRVALEQNPSSAVLILAQCRLLLRNAHAPHCVTLLERLPSLSSDAKVLREGQLLLAAALASSNDVLGCIDVLNKLNLVESVKDRPEFPLVFVSGSKLSCFCVFVLVLIIGSKKKKC
jgi:hypothetical protein